ncbi:MAG TPA: glycosyltransferase family 4 protein, partial [Nitrospiria bacterium]|nr:glycosyltransferase family 4 protein [Nitrospiria bacterium]
MKALHVAFFNRSFHPEVAATGQLLTELCEDLVSRHGFRVSVVAGVPLGESGFKPPTSGGLFFHRERHRGVDVLRARGTRFSKKSILGRICNYLTYFLSACITGLRLERPDVVVAFTDPPIIGLAAYLTSRRFGVPLVLSCRDVYPEVAEITGGFKSKWGNRILWIISRFLIKKADRTVALGETMRQRLIAGKGADPAKVMVIPDWADCGAITPGPKRNAFSLTHDLADTFVVMHSGNIGLTQDLETLIDAAARLGGFPEIEIVFVGDGVKREPLEAKAEALGLKNVRFLPFAPKEKLHESFAAADLFVVSLKRGLSGYIVPSKLYGILAAGRPYVAAVDPETEVAAITKEYECGILVRPGD